MISQAEITAAQKTLATESVGIFDTYDDLFETVKELGSEGFGRHQISVRGSDAAMKESFGTDSVAPQALEDDPAAPHSPIISIEELGIAQGVLVGAGIYIAACVAIFATNGLVTPNAILTLIASSVFGGALGAVLAWALGAQYHTFFRRQAEAGGLVLWIETPDEFSQHRAEAILRKHGAHDIHIHELAMAA